FLRDRPQFRARGRAARDICEVDRARAQGRRPPQHPAPLVVDLLVEQPRRRHRRDPRVGPRERLPGERPRPRVGRDPRGLRRRALMRPVWVGSAAERIGRLHGGRVTPAVSAATPTFLAEHPRLPRLYAADERDPGRVAAFAVGPEGALTRTGVAEIGGAGPCHVTVHPDGGWLYAACYGDGVVSALALDVHGDLTGDPVVLPHHGRGPHPDRQQGPHAHSTWVSPGGGWLVAADLGTDQLRAYRLDGGRPGGEPVLSDLPAGSGPRHAAVVGDRVHVACELSCEVVTLAWDEPSGRAEVLGAVTVVTLPPRTGTEHTLSHIEPLDARTLVVGVRGADSL